VLRALFFKAVFYAGSTLYVLAAPLYALAGRQVLIPHVRRWARFHDWCCRRLLGIGCRVEGVLPRTPVLVAMKHEAMYETIQAVELLDAPAPVFKRELMKIPVWGHALLSYAGAKALRAMLAEAKHLIADGRSILIFPEGTRVPHGETPEMKSGLAGLYRLLGLPIVPIACDSGRFLPKHGRPRSGTITFRVGETIPPGLPREEVELRVHAAINALNQ